jgi:PAS domain S-box-containing protein
MHANWPKRMSLAAGALATALGVAVLVGWLLGYLPLIQVFPSVAAPMQRMTALGFLLSGLALIFAAQGRRGISVLMQFVVFFMSILVILEYVLGLNLGIDELLGPAYVVTHTSNRGRMSPVSALCFAGVSVAILTMWSSAFSRRTLALRGIVGCVLAVVGGVSVLGFFIGHTEAYGWGEFTRLAPHSAAGFILLGLGLVALSWQEKTKPGLPDWAPAGAAFVVAVGVLGFWQALVLHEEGKFTLLAHVLLFSGFVVAMLLGITIQLALQARERNRDLHVYRMAFENSFDGQLLTRLDGSIQTANPSACAILGRSEEEIRQVGRAGIVDTDDPRLQQILEERSRSGKAHGELRAKRKDGSLIPTEISSVVFKDTKGDLRSTLAFRDISERKQAESELRLQTERLSLATRAASIGVWEWDLRTNQSIWDDTCFEMYGVPRNEPMSYQKWSRLVHPDDLAQVEESLQRVIRLKTQDSVEFRIVRPDGSLRYTSAAQGIVLDERGEPVRMVGINIDTTEQRRMRAQLEASSRFSSLGMMAGGIAHEINNPLTIIQASTSDMLDQAQETEQVPSKDVVRNSKRIRETANRIAHIVKSLRHIAREGSHDEFSATSVAKIVEETLEMCRERFKSRSVKLIIPKIDPELRVACREVQIAQVLLNLLQNAFDAVADKPGERWVRLDVGAREATIFFAVTDSGPGVPAELRTKIMEPFFTTKDVGKGAGLGLSLSTAIAEEHGGKLELADEGGHTCFCLTLPISREMEPICSYQKLRPLLSTTKS